MRLFLTPGELHQRSELYHQLGSLTSAGLGMLRAVEMLQRNPPSRSFRRPLSQLGAFLNQGMTVSEALSHLSSWMPAFDIALVQAGEQSGRLDASLKMLAGYYGERAQQARHLLAGLAYPVVLLHAAVFLFPFARFFASGNLGAYLRQTLGVLVPLYMGGVLLLWASQGRHGERWRAFLEWASGPVPLLGKARRELALARLAAALEALISAGLPVIEAWDLASAASGSPALCRTVRAWKPHLSAGQTPAEAVSQSRAFPELFAGLYQAGEISGQLDETLRRLRAHYQEEGFRKMNAFTQWVPRLFYFGIMLVISYKVIRFYTGYFQPLDDLMGR